MRFNKWSLQLQVDFKSSGNKLDGHLFFIGYSLLVINIDI